MTRLIWYGVSVAIAGLAAAILGQDDTTSTSNSSSSYVQLSKLVGRKVRSSHGEEIGVIKDVVLDRSNGCMVYTVVSTGSAEKGGDKIVVVPWAVYSPSSDPGVLTVKLDRDKVYKAPMFDYTRIDEYVRPDYIDNIYTYYGLDRGPRTGAGASNGATAATDASGTAGATATPGEVASPTAARTVSTSNSELARALATHAASPTGAAITNPSRQSARGTRASGTRPLPSRENAESSTTTKESSSESISGSSESRKSRRKAINEKSTARPTETPTSAEADD